MKQVDPPCCLLLVSGRKRERDSSLIECSPPLFCTLFPDFALGFLFHHTLKGAFVQRENKEEAEKDGERGKKRSSNLFPMYFSSRQTSINLPLFHCGR